MRIHRREPNTVSALPADMHPVLRRVYARRGVTAADLDLRLARLAPFESLKGIDAACGLLRRALEESWRILIVGDFDADGACSTALAVEGLSRMGAAQVDYLIPDRFAHGYGLSETVVDLAAEFSPQLLITVDNGISSLDGVARARAQGIKVLITDHHLPGEVLPDADAIVNPNQPGCGFASRCLAGVGVVFYLLLALRAHLREAARFPRGLEPNLGESLDLVALGTVADVVPLDFNNRILVKQGLKRMRAGRCRPGIRALAQVAGRSLDRLVAADIGFAIAPRLNAAGRLEDMRLGVECLLAANEETARQAALRLDELNRRRRELQAQMQDEAMAAVAAVERQLGRDLPAGLCVYRPDWHEGIVGLVAGRVRERHHRPTVAFAPADTDSNMLKGSARSVPAVHIRDALESIATAHPGLIERFGGHAMAAGLSLARDHLPDFQSAFAEQMARCLSSEQLAGTIETDGELQAQELDLEAAIALREAGPWGADFPEPTFDGQFVVLDQRIVGERHLKLRLRPVSGNQALDGIFFNRDTLVDERRPVRLVYRLDCNEYQGLMGVQMVIEHIDEGQPK